MSNALGIRFRLQTETVFLTEGLAPARAIKKHVTDRPEHNPPGSCVVLGAATRPLLKQNHGCCSGTHHGLYITGQTAEEHIFHSKSCNKQWQPIDLETY